MQGCEMTSAILKALRWLSIAGELLETENFTVEFRNVVREAVSKAAKDLSGFQVEEPLSRKPARARQSDEFLTYS
jgi:hypothetical protein